MIKPKRHHWWPIAQSKHWTDSNGLIFVTRRDGTAFQANPLNIGAESELYTRFGEDNSKDTEIEQWFAEAIDGPAAKMIEHLLDSANIHRSPFEPEPSKAEVAKALGFRVNRYIDRINLPSDVRQAIASYLAALLVRHPRYLAKLIRFHEQTGAGINTRDRALDNMLHLYNVYVERIVRSIFMVSRRVGNAEYLYSDGGLMLEEPWRRDYDIPFDIHAPLTPDIAIQVLPVPTGGDLSTAMIMESTQQGVARQNRISLAGAERFVFSRHTPPSQFIFKHFGKPAPKNIGYTLLDGRLETFYDPSRR
jgi:hypothetical protein